MEVTVLRGTVGSGDGSGDGYGSGDGSGSGYGDGSGDGYGYGYGSGYGSKEYWLSCLKYFSEKWGEAQRARLAELQKASATIAFWWSDKTGKACNGGKNAPVTSGTIEQTQGPLHLCERGTLHATALPPKWKGDRLWCVALHGDVVGDEEKYGALEREIIGECE